MSSHPPSSSNSNSNSHAPLPHPTSLPTPPPPATPATTNSQNQSRRRPPKNNKSNPTSAPELGPAADKKEDLGVPVQGPRETQTKMMRPPRRVNVNIPRGLMPVGVGGMSGAGGGAHLARPFVSTPPFAQGPGPLTLEGDIQRLYHAHRASPSALSARHTLITRLNQIFNTSRFPWGHPHSPSANPIIIEPFGSVRFGLTTSSSDLDLCLLDPYRPNGFDEKFFRTEEGEGKGALPGIYDMKRIEWVLKENGFMNVRAIQWAKVPICKFEARVNGEVIQADINTNERFGVLNSSLLNSYVSLHPSIRPLCVFLKSYFRHKNLNDPSGASGLTTFSSYSIILLLLAFLQKKNLIPNLQSEGLIESFGVERTWFWTRPGKVYKWGHEKVKPDGEPGSEPTNPPTTFLPKSGLDLKVTSRPKRNSTKTFLGINPSHGWDTTFVSSSLYIGDSPNASIQFPSDGSASVENLVKEFFRYYSEEVNWKEEVVTVSCEGSRGRGRMERKDTYEKGLSERARTRAITKAMNKAKEEKEKGKGKEVDQVNHTANLLASQSISSPPASVSATSPNPPPEIDDPEPEPEPETETHDFSSRSSSPILHSNNPNRAVEDQPSEIWKNQIVVIQDPFIRTRNTSGNIGEEVLRVLTAEMKHTLKLLEEGCQSVDILFSSSPEDKDTMKSLLKSSKSKGLKKDGTTGGNGRNRNRQQKKEREAAAQGASTNGQQEAGGGKVGE